MKKKSAKKTPSHAPRKEKKMNLIKKQYDQMMREWIKSK